MSIQVEICQSYHITIPPHTNYKITKFLEGWPPFQDLPGFSVRVYLSSIRQVATTELGVAEHE